MRRRAIIFITIFNRGKNMYNNIRKYDIRYLDVDFKDEIRLSAILSLLEESACASADELGFGYKDIAPVNIGFVIVNWYLEVYRPIKLGEKLTVHTWPMKPARTSMLREFEIYSGEEKVAAGTTRWCMVDIRTFALLPTSAFFSGDTREYNERRAIDYSSWHIAPLTDGEKKYEKLITVSDYDHYFHCNNTKYADICLDAFTVDELASKSIAKVQISYIKQCKFGELLEIYRHDDGDVSLLEGRVNGEPRVRLRVTFRNL